MKKRSYKLSVCGIELTAAYFVDELGLGRREPLGEIFDKISSTHFHAEYEAFFFWNGDMEVVCENYTRCYSDSVVIVPSNLGHYTVMNAENVFVIYFDIDKEQGEKLLSRLSKSVVAMEISEKERFYLGELVASEGERRDESFHLISLLLSELFRRILPGIGGSELNEEFGGKYVSELSQYLSENYAEHITLADVASALHICERQVSRVIKREYDCTFCELVNNKRLSVAVMMLKHTDMTVTEIARATGFENDNYFYRVFKKKYGVTPGEYRH